MKPSGSCPVQAEGYFRGYYFYFRSRWDRATIEFSKTQEDWERDVIVRRYVLMTLDSPDAGWIPKWMSWLLIGVGCVRFYFRRYKKQTNI